MKRPQFAFEILRRAELRPGETIVIACSGGLDSVSLLDVLSREPSVTFEIAHVHHGRRAHEESDFRDRALDFVREIARVRGVKFHERISPRALETEAEMRTFRLESLKEIAGTRRVAFAHHADDLLETRLIRLIRGTSLKGLKAMSKSTERSVRPFLQTRRAFIEAYARQNKLEWIEDPSNRDAKFLRNWIRREWLPLLETRASLEPLARSLDLIAESAGEPAHARPTAVERADFQRSNENQKREQILGLVQGLKGDVKDFSLRRIHEVLKRLDRLELTRQKQASFTVGGVQFLVSKDRIVAEIPG